MFALSVFDYLILGILVCDLVFTCWCLILLIKCFRCLDGFGFVILVFAVLLLFVVVFVLLVV